MKRLLFATVLLLLIAMAPLSWDSDRLRLGSKKFTESVILGETARLLAADAGTMAIHYRELGGTKLVYQALLQGEIDLYPEYSGTIREEILTGDNAAELSLAAIRELLAADGISVSRPLGFNNTYAIAMRRERAAELHVANISDLRRHPDLVFGFGNEFMNRNDGWPNLRRVYGLPQRNVAGLDHDLAYRQLELGAIDVIDAYSTDAKIAAYDLVLLEDDLGYFPRYEAVLLYRSELRQSYPEGLQAMLRLEGTVGEREMMQANAAVELGNVSETRAAAKLCHDNFGVLSSIEDPTRASRILNRTGEHLDLVRRSLIPAILLAIPLGILAAKFHWVGQVILAVVGVVQTIPSLALLVMLMPPIALLGLASVGLGSSTAVAALLLYSLLPIVRNTHSGLQSIAPEHRETSIALGLPPLYRLWHIELPLASRSILAGIKTAAVLNVGFATLGALIGAGGYGQPIITGIRLNDTGLILEGAIPAALLALLVQIVFEYSERWLVPRGLRLEAGR